MVVREHDHVTRMQVHCLAAIGQADTAASLREQVVDHHVLGGREQLRHVGAVGCGIHAPGRGEFRVQKDAAGQMQDFEHFRQRVHGIGREGSCANHRPDRRRLLRIRSLGQVLRRCGQAIPAARRGGQDRRRRSQSRRGANGEHGITRRDLREPHPLRSRKHAMNAIASPDTRRYARCIEASKRIRWDIDKDVIRGRSFDYGQKWLPDGLSMAARLSFLDDADKRFASQVQGRTYANMFGLVERFIGVKILEVSRDHWLGDQVALEALVRFTDEELKHQELFRRIELMMGMGMPAGYRFLPEPNDVANAVLGACTWAVLALTCHIELFSQGHYRSSIERDENLSLLWKDVFMYHWREESQHAILDELEWVREDAKLSAKQRDKAVDDLIGLVGAVDGILQVQSKADAEYLVANTRHSWSEAEKAVADDTFLRAYRHQYIILGVQEERFQKTLGSLISPAQSERIGKALAPILT